MPNQREIHFKPEHASLRIDQALKEYYPELSLRARRRLLNFCQINGRPAARGHKIRPGEILTIFDCHELQADSIPKPVLLATRNGLLWLFKPAGLHCAALAGKDCFSLESFLHDSLAETRSILLQRLDCQTCGLVCAAPEIEARRLEEAQRRGLCKKAYLALLNGKLEISAIVKNRLDASNRKTVKILKENAERSRWTIFEPLPELKARLGENGRACSWALCRIARGQRHQIRAHAAAIGHPLAGDSLYGGGGNGDFLLRCVSLNILDETFIDLENRPGAFLLPENAADIVKKKLEISEDL